MWKLIAVSLLFVVPFHSTATGDDPVPPKMGRAVRVYQLKHIRAAEAEIRLLKYLNKKNKKKEGSAKDENLIPTRVISDSVTNTLLVSSDPKRVYPIYGAIFTIDMAEFERKNPSSTPPLHAFYNDEIYTGSFDLTEVINYHLAKPRVNGLNEAELEIHKALWKPVSFDFSDAPFQDIIKQFAISNNINILLDSDGLKDVGINRDSPITTGASQIKLGTALSQILEPMNLDFLVEDEVLKITIRKRMKNSITKLYAVPDLVASVDSPEGLGKAVIDFKTLIDKIKKNVFPLSWEFKDSEAEIWVEDSCLSLAITQSRQGHQEIQKYLTGLRKARLKEYGIELD